MSPPRIWLLIGAKQGDNAQAERLAEAAGLAFERRRLVLKPGYDLAKPRIEASLHHVDLAQSDALTPPWPDLILTIGRRMAMAALWIKAQSDGRTKLALIGPPKSNSAQFDLIVVPFHYRARQEANICRIGLPLLGIDPKRVAAESERWRPAFAHLPRPLTVLLCGGSIGTHSFDPETARAILATIARMGGGSLEVATSRRTPPETADAIAAALPPQARLHRWEKAGKDNPYIGLLGHGDRFVVTGDSISMLIEVARLGKPLAIAPMRKANRTVADLVRRLHVPDEMAYDIAGMSQRVMDRFLPLIGKHASTRDFSALHDLMYRKGWAVRLGEAFVTPAEPPADDAAIAAARLRALLEAPTLPERLI
jgi:mitochondrial fission protein ELM1